jgi:antibiotic biosynthesis monooxygenase (ABM) superfamily enzyme
MKTKMKLMMALKIWIAIYPSITLFLYLFGGPLSAFPLYLRTLVLTLSLVPWIVFVGVPVVDLLIRRLSIKKE